MEIRDGNILIDPAYNFEDYKIEFGNIPFGLLIRKIAKLEVQPAKEVFSKFITEQNLNSNQINFVNKIVDYVVQNGYIKNNMALMKSPFDKL